MGFQTRNKNIINKRTFNDNEAKSYNFQIQDVFHYFLKRVSEHAIKIESIKELPMTNKKAGMN